ncbi:MAG: DUF3990 domain-containing protein [Candidatus Competibacteraceae bacterium]
MPWNNGSLTVYHGCDEISANYIMQLGINLTKCKPLTDFGQGFYTTTSLVQAKSWANQRCNRVSLRNRIAISTVLKFDIDRYVLAQQEILFFIIESANTDYWDFVGHCRTIAPAPGQHKLRGRTNYDVVAGPVSLWPQPLVIKDCDQVSFHTPRSLHVLPQAQICAQGTPNNPRL